MLRVIRIILWAGRLAGPGCRPDAAEVVGSNPTPPTKLFGDWRYKFNVGSAIFLWGTAQAGLLTLMMTPASSSAPFDSIN